MTLTPDVAASLRSGDNKYKMFYNFVKEYGLDYLLQDNSSITDPIEQAIHRADYSDALSLASQCIEHCVKAVMLMKGYTDSQMRSAGHHLRRIYDSLSPTDQANFDRIVATVVSNEEGKVDKPDLKLLIASGKYSIVKVPSIKGKDFTEKRYYYSNIDIPTIVTAIESRHGDKFLIRTRYPATEEINFTDTNFVIGFAVATHELMLRDAPREWISQRSRNDEFDVLWPKEVKDSFKSSYK